MKVWKRADVVLKAVKADSLYHTNLLRGPEPVNGVMEKESQTETLRRRDIGQRNGQPCKQN